MALPMTPEQIAITLLALWGIYSAYRDGRRERYLDGLDARVWDNEERLSELEKKQ